MSRRKPSLAALTIGSIGVVYGDIGTSPLYAFRQSLAEAGGSTLDHMAILGLLSLILWALVVVVTMKYVMLVLRADNKGEGGILSLMALALGSLHHQPKLRSLVLFMGMAGAALFYGDALITPAISVMSAVEGLNLLAPHFMAFVIPTSMAIITFLFVLQRRGTEKVAGWFGPVMLVWFATLAIGGLNHITDSPEVWQALDPRYGLHFITHHGYAGFITLGAVFLSVTGAEALFADLGHFGKRPIRIAWLGLVMPALMLNYFGQGALILSNPQAIGNPFFLLYPDWALAPMVALATLATIIASQAVITGTFSLTHQAMQLQLLPRMHVRYTSEEHAGRIYIPTINWMLLVGVLLFIPLFRTSSALAAAYGIAVTGTMVITAVLVFVVMRRVWHWPLPVAVLVTAPLLAIDSVFLAANLTKFADGGFVPLLISAGLVTMMHIWVKGCHELHCQTQRRPMMAQLLSDLRHAPVKRTPGTAVYVTSSHERAPSALLENLKHNKVLHEHNVLMTLKFSKMPFIDEEKRIELDWLEDDFARVILHFGFMDPPNITRQIHRLRSRGLKLDLMSTTFFLSRRNLTPSAQFGMPLWQDYIFIFMARAASDTSDYFNLPRSRVLELGVPITI